MLRSSAYAKLESLVQAVRGETLEAVTIAGLRGELATYLERQISLFGEYAEMFWEQDTREGFLVVADALQHLRELTEELARPDHLDEHGWSGFLEEAREANQALVGAADFLRG